MKRYILLLSSLAVLTLINITPASAASGFEAGRIIDDAVFTNKSTMSVADIQAFLNSKVPSCDTNGQQLSEFGGPDINGDGKVQRWEWGKQKYNQTSFPCLKEYSQDGVSAAQLIYNASQNYSINPQVMLVLLQKEQGLVTDTWPLNIQYRSATGYGCPDTAACDSQYYGLKNQLNWAATMFRAIMNDSPTWYTPYVLGDNYIQYSPNASCGGSNVYIQNRSTQALYNYTPYQPSQAALDAGWGQVNCGAYGNRNFYLYFTSWFGSTLTSYKSLDTQRWMELSINTHKKNPFTGENVDEELAQGKHLRFIDKININGQWYLRTEYDSKNNINKGILLSDITDIKRQAFVTPRYMQLKSDRKKWLPITGIVDNSESYPKDTVMKFTHYITVNDIEYYMSEYDANHNLQKYITSSAIGELVYVPFEHPRFMNINSDTTKINPATDEVISTITEGQTLKFTSKVKTSLGWFYRTDHDSDNNLLRAIPANQISEIAYTAFETPRYMQLKISTNKYVPSSEQTIDNTLPQDTQVRITSKISINGTTYLRSEHDTNNSLNKAFAEADLEEIPYVALENPRYLQLRTDTYKQNPKTGIGTDHILNKGTQIKFTTKILVNGMWYLRTEYDTNQSLDKGVLSSQLEEV